MSLTLLTAWLSGEHKQIMILGVCVCVWNVLKKIMDAYFTHIYVAFYGL